MLSKTIEKRNYWLFILGKGISLIGSRLFGFIVGFYILQQTGSGMNFAITIIISTLPYILLSPIAGDLCDRLNKKTLIVLFDFLSGITMFLALLVIPIFINKIILLYVTTLVLSIFNSFFSVAITSAIPEITNKDNLGKINSVNSLIQSIAGIAGPIIGGILFAIFKDIKIFLFINGISFILSGISETFIVFNVENHSKEKVSRQNNFIENFRESFAYLKSKQVLYLMMWAILFINFLFVGFSVFLNYALVEVHELTSSQVGFISSIVSVGMILRSILLSKKESFGDTFKLLIKNTFFIAIIVFISGIMVYPSIPILPNIGYILFYSTIMFCLGYVVVNINVPIITYFQKIVDSEYRGRVTGILSSASQAIQPLGAIIFGIMVDQMPTYLVPLTVSIGIIFYNFILNRKYDQIPQTTQLSAVQKSN